MTGEMLFVLIGFLLGGVTSGVAGFGIMMVALPILTLGLNTTDAVLLCCIVGTFTSIQLAWLYRRFAVLDDMKMLWLGCVPGCVAGAHVLKVVPISYLQIGISITIAFFVFLQILREKAVWALPDSRSSLFVAGAASGFTNATVSLPGVPIGIFILLKKWDRDRSRATMSMLFALSSPVTMASQWAVGLYTADLFILSLGGIVSAFLGQEIGYRAGRYLNQNMFIRIILFFLSIAATTLFYKALQ